MATGKKLPIIAPLVASLLLGGFMLVTCRRSPPAYDADLVPVRRTVAEQDNAFSLLTQAAAASYWPTNKPREMGELSSGTKWDADLAAEVLAKNGEALALFERSMACAELQVPAIKSADDELPYLSKWRKLALIASIQAAKLFREGNELEALSLALRIIQLGHRAENSDGPVIVCLVGSSIKQIGLRQVRQSAWETTLPPQQLIACIAKLEQYRANEPGLTNALKIEYQIYAKQTEDFFSGRVPDGTNSASQQMFVSATARLTIDLNRTKNLLAKDIRILLGSVPMHLSEMPLSEIFARSDSTINLKSILRGNPMGEMVAKTQAGGWPGVLNKKCQENSAVSATQLSLALKCFYTKHGNLPENLSELVPEFLPAIPLDDFDGKPMRYSRERRLLWSIGMDLIDSDGRTYKEDPKSDDILFDLELKPAPARE